MSLKRIGSVILDSMVLGKRKKDLMRQNYLQRLLARLAFNDLLIETACIIVKGGAGRFLF